MQMEGIATELAACTTVMRIAARLIAEIPPRMDTDDLAKEMEIKKTPSKGKCMSKQRNSLSLLGNSA